jgi:hypothetical protein
VQREIPGGGVRDVELGQVVEHGLGKAVLKTVA